uniref:Uncharacterized protein n=1 Tax=Arundo donax TaxID=35708 RepID=A0A0A9FTD4_ARUDO
MAPPAINATIRNPSNPQRHESAREFTQRKGIRFNWEY